MVYEKKVMRGDRVHATFYYSNFKAPDGAIRKEFLGSDYDEALSKEKFFTTIGFKKLDDFSHAREEHHKKETRLNEHLKELKDSLDLSDSLNLKNSLKTKDDLKTNFIVDKSDKIDKDDDVNSVLQNSPISLPAYGTKIDDDYLDFYDKYFDYKAQANKIGKSENNFKSNKSYNSKSDSKTSIRQSLKSKSDALELPKVSLDKIRQHIPEADNRDHKLAYSIATIISVFAIMFFFITMTTTPQELAGFVVLPSVSQSTNNLGYNVWDTGLKNLYVDRPTTLELSGLVTDKVDSFAARVSGGADVSIEGTKLIITPKKVGDYKLTLIAKENGISHTIDIELSIGALVKQ